MARSVRFLIFPSLFLTGSSLLAGCSFIGLELGSTIDPPRSERYLAGAQGLYNLPRNTDLLIEKKDGTEIEGTSLGITYLGDTALSERYREAFGQWRLQLRGDSSNIPSLGANIWVWTRSRHGDKDLLKGSFAGFDHGVLGLLPSTGGAAMLARLDDVKAVYDSLGHPIATGEMIFKAASDGVPYASHLGARPAVLLQGQNCIPLDEIVSARVPARKSTGKWIGLGVGAAIDIAIIAAVAASAREGFFHRGFW